MSFGAISMAKVLSPDLHDGAGILKSADPRNRKRLGGINSTRDWVDRVLSVVQHLDSAQNKRGGVLAFIVEDFADVLDLALHRERALL